MSIDKNSFPKVIDTDSPYDDNKNAADAKNITYIGNDSRNVGHAMPILGNRPAFDMGSVSQQNKIYRVTVPSIASYSIAIYNSDRSEVIFNANFINVATAVVAIQAAALLTGNTAIVTPVGSAYFEMQLIPIPNIPAYRWFIKDNSSLLFPFTQELQIEVIQEAIEPTLAGELVDIGGFDLLGDLFITSTSQRNLPTPLDVTIASVSGNIPSVPITITFTSPHGLVNGQWITNSEFEGNVSANGYFSVIVVSNTSIRLANSGGSGAWVNGTGVITIHVSGIGEVGVAQKDATTLDWYYTRLLRSVEWNWNTKKQFDLHCDKTATTNGVYGANDYTPPFVFYYKGAYIPDGGLALNGGQYNYDSVFSETRLFLSVLNTKIEFTEQIQSGGALKSGNNRYAVRALTETATATDWGDVTNPVNVYSAIQTPPEDVVGDVSGTLTSKINVLTVTNINSQIFKYIEVACVEYRGLAVSGYIVDRYVVTGETMVIRHTGNEPTRVLDVNEIQAFSIPVDTAKNIRAIDNRLILSNITTAPDVDLTEIVNKVRHSVVRKTIPSVGGLFFSGTGGTESNISFGEYQDPNNVNDNVGYMMNETYRFSIKARFRVGGSWTKNYWADDIKIDNLGVNNGNPTDNRRNAGLPNLDLKDSVTGEVFVPYIEFTNFNFDAVLEDGSVFRDVFDAISIERAECIPEILFTGMARLGCSFPVTYAGTQYETPAHVEPRGSLAIGLNYGFVNPLNQRFDFASIYSPDILLANNGFLYSGGDSIINHGTPSVLYSFAQGNGVQQSTGMIQFEGDLKPSANLVALGAAQAIFGENLIPVQNELFSNSRTFQNSPTPPVWFYAKCVAVKISGSINSNPTWGGSSNLYGYSYVQYYRQQSDKYGQFANTQYISCGNLYDIGSSTLVSTFDVLGGDTFTQKSWFKTTTNQDDNSVPPIYGSGYLNDGIGFYSQNRVNSQMRQKSSTAAGGIFPSNATGTNPIDRVLNWLRGNSGVDAIQEEFLGYDLGYNIINGVDYHIAFNPDLIQNNDQPTRIIWSELKPQNAIADLYRVFLPLNFKDLDNSFGEINHHENVNGELFTLQSKKWQRQFFNTRGTLQVQNISEVLIGDGSVMSRDGQTISNFGTQNKWAVILGKSKGGNDVIFWWDGINKMWMRFGGDGTLSLSEIKGMENFAANNLNWVVPNDTPADGAGIHGVWHQRMGEAIWFVRAKRGAISGGANIEGSPRLWRATTNFNEGNIVFYPASVGVYSPAVMYSKGDVVLYNGIYYASQYPNNIGNTVFPSIYWTAVNPFSTFEQTGEFYRSLINGNAAFIPTLHPERWELISHADVNYYSEFSIAFNEKLNEVTQAKTPSGFSSFYTPLPMIAHEWTNGYVSPRPISPLSKHYEHNRGAYLTWYEHNGVSQIEEGYVELVINKDTDMPMLYQALVVNADNRPYKISFYTQGQETFISAADFEVMNGVWQAAIKNDITGVVVQPVNEQDTSQMFGTYIRVRFYFEVDKFNAINDFIVKFIALHRNYQS